MLILAFQDKLIKNATAIPFNRTLYGHLALVVDDQEYLEATNQVWVDPVDLSLNPTTCIPNGATAAQIQEHICQHNEQVQVYSTFITTKNLLPNMIINVIDDKYINTLKHRIMKYSKVELLDLINHLKDHYSQITVDDLI